MKHHSLLSTSSYQLSPRPQLASSQSLNQQALVTQLMVFVQQALNLPWDSIKHTQALSRYRGEFMRHLDAFAASSNRTLLLAYCEELIDLLHHKPAEQQKLHIVQLVEDIHHCTPGFLIRLQREIRLLQEPDSLGAYLDQFRWQLVDQVASVVSSTSLNMQALMHVHVNQACFSIACQEGYGIPSFINDISFPSEKELDIKRMLSQCFALKYTPVCLVRGVFLGIVKQHGYTGERSEGYVMGDYDSFYTLAHQVLERESGDLSYAQLFILDENHGVTDLNWAFVQSELLQLFESKGYFQTCARMQNNHSDSSISTFTFFHEPIVAPVITETLYSLHGVFSMLNTMLGLDLMPDPVSTKGLLPAALSAQLTICWYWKDLWHSRVTLLIPSLDSEPDQIFESFLANAPLHYLQEEDRQSVVRDVTNRFASQGVRFSFFGLIGGRYKQQVTAVLDMVPCFSSDLPEWVSHDWGFIHLMQFANHQQASHLIEALKLQLSGWMSKGFLCRVKKHLCLEYQVKVIRALFPDIVRWVMKGGFPVQVLPLNFPIPITQHLTLCRDEFRVIVQADLLGKFSYIDLMQMRAYACRIKSIDSQKYGRIMVCLSLLVNSDSLVDLEGHLKSLNCVLTQPCQARCSLLGWFNKVFQAASVTGHDLAVQTGIVQFSSVS